MKVRTRFAPSPTGYMHIGNLRTALYAYLFAKKNNGTLILRIEDTDQRRYVADAVDFIKRTLKAAKIVPDEGPGIGGDFGPYVQSERMNIYKEYALKLIDLGAAYPCFCDAQDALVQTRERDATVVSADAQDALVQTLERRTGCASAGKERDATVFARRDATFASADETESEKSFGGYNRACRDIPLEEAKERMKTESYVIRQKMPLTGETSFFDVLHGTVTFQNEELEDQVLLKRDGMPTYNFANVIDDHLMEVSHIMRGTEFITSTPKHVLLYQAFGWEPPAFVHLSPVMGKDAEGKISKLSKRHGATSFEDLVNMGYLPEAITNYVALLGWNPKNSTQEIFSMEELIDAFSLEGLSKSNSVFDYEKLNWMNSEYLKAMNEEDFLNLAKKFAGNLGNLENSFNKIAFLLKTRLSKLSDIESEMAFLKEFPPFDENLYTNKRNKVTPEFAKEILPSVYALLEAVPESEWENSKLYEKLTAFIEENGYKKGAALWPIRISIANKTVTPGGATELLDILGKEESLKRMKESLENLQK